MEGFNIISIAMLAKLVIASGILSLTCLLILHFVSPEFKPSWRMISEYALGKHKWLITSFFYLWGISSFLLVILLWSVVTSKLAMFGVLILLVTCVGEFMGGAFDLKHKLHGFAFLLGVPFLPIAALIISYHLISLPGWNANSSSILFATHATWISLVLMSVAMVAMLTGFKKAGIVLGPDVEPPSEVPDGVVALNGYTNRILVASYIYWLIVIAKSYLTV